MGESVFRLDGRVAIVTGSTKGIGKAMARGLSEAGATVVVSSRKQELCDEVAGDLAAETGGEFLALACHVGEWDAVAGFIAKVHERLGRIDVLVNNAGITRDTLIMRMSEDDWDSVVDTNLKSAFLVTKAVMRQMLKQRAGRIVNITSISGVMGNAGQANYSASKAGLMGLTRSTAREVASRNITCNAIAAGVVDTDIWQGVPQAAIDAMLERIPAGRKGTPDDIAEAAAFLASDAASYITGQVLNVDGGLVMA
jgi:3-oxoacyl-[acyl-carrier protein] reductase